eukprot:173709_1
MLVQPNLIFFHPDAHTTWRCSDYGRSLMIASVVDLIATLYFMLGLLSLGNHYYWVWVLIVFIITFIIFAPGSLPVFCFIYHKKTALIHTENSIVFNKWSIKDKQEIYDKIYSINHLRSHYETPNIYNDEHHLMLISDLDNKILEHSSTFDSRLCVEYQQQYFSLTKRKKAKYIKTFKHNSLWQRIQNISFVNKYKSICLVWFVIYIISRLCVMIFFPLYYVWTLVIGFKYYYILICFILLVYGLFMYYFLRKVIFKLKCEYWFGYFMQFDLIFLEDMMETFVNEMRAIKMISEIMPNDIATIICIYLISIERN